MSDKGSSLEELLRAYFLRAGFFVVRGVPVTLDGDDLTDIDLWLYERPTGTTRRIQIVDIKYKQRPKAAERLFWTRGLLEAIRADDAYVATTDKRKSLRKIADRIRVSLIDGTDIQRIRESQNVLFPERLSEEQFLEELRKVDQSRHDKFLQDARFEILSGLTEKFGALSLVRSLESFVRLAIAVAKAHPGSEAAIAAGRLAYFAAAIACQSLDYVSVLAPFRSLDERKELILNALRYGVVDKDEGTRTLRIAVELIRKYAPSGGNSAQAIDAKYRADLDAIPAEIVADQAVRLFKDGQLFAAGKELELAAYGRTCPPFDQLSSLARSMIGAFLDYAGLRREDFARAWNSVPTASIDRSVSEVRTPQSSVQVTMFEAADTAEKPKPPPKRKRP